MKPNGPRGAMLSALCSVALHGALLLWVLWPGSTPRAAHPPRTIDVVLLPEAAASGHATAAPSSALRTAKSEPAARAADPTIEKKAPVPAALEGPAEAAAGPGAREPAPSRGAMPDADRYSALQRQSFEAQRRAVLAASVAAGVSNAAAVLQPLLKTRIDCVRQTDGTLRCTPEPEDGIRPVLGQLAGLVSEGHRLGVLANPLHVDLGGEREVTISLLP